MRVHVLVIVSVCACVCTCVCIHVRGCLGVCAFAFFFFCARTGFLLLHKCSHAWPKTHTHAHTQSFLLLAALLPVCSHQYLPRNVPCARARARARAHTHTRTHTHKHAVYLHTYSHSAPLCLQAPAHSPKRPQRQQLQRHWQRRRQCR